MGLYTELCVRPGSPTAAVGLETWLTTSELLGRLKEFTFVWLFLKVLSKL